MFDPRCPRCDAPLAWALVGEDAPIRPRSSYAASKARPGALRRRVGDARGRPRASALRYHNVYGPDMPADTPYAGVAAIFRSALERGEGPPVFEDGAQMRDFVHVDDVAAANVAAVRRGVGGTTRVGVTRVQRLLGLARTDIATMAALIAQEPAAPSRWSPATTGAADVRHVVAIPARPPSTASASPPP